ncbi:MAG: hypothetical protein ACWA6X_10340 [Bauldia sp.]
MGLLLPPHALFGSAAALAEPPYAFANAEAETLVAAMTVAPNGARKALIDTFVGSLKTAGVWAKLDVMWVLAAHDEQAGRLNWVTPGSFTLTAVNTVTFTADRGFAGNGTNSYLDTGWDWATNGAQFTQNNAHHSQYSRTSGNNLPSFGTGSGSSYNNQSRANSGSNARVSINSGTNINSSSGGTLPLQIIARRLDSASQSMLRDGIEIVAPTAAPSTSSASTDDWRFGRTGPTYSTAQIAGGTAGAYLDDAEGLALYNAWNTYMIAIGADT